MWIIAAVALLGALSLLFIVIGLRLRNSADLKLWDIVALVLLELVFWWFILTDLHPWNSWPFND